MIPMTSSYNISIMISLVSKKNMNTFINILVDFSSSTNYMQSLKWGETKVHVILNIVFLKCTNIRVITSLENEI